MATSLQRLLVLTIGIYMILVITGLLYSQASILTIEEEFTQSSDNIRNFSENYRDKYQQDTPDVNTVYLTQQAGDQKFGGRSWIEVFLRPALGVIDAPDSADWLEIRLTKMINWIIHIIQMIIALEVFLLLYSKKTS